MPDTYVNPVFKRSAPDPFVFKHRGEYWCISSNCQPNQRKFEMLRSPDLVHWQVMGGALEPLAVEHPHYWAPEITYLNGVFYLYYSVGNETLMQLRVATSRNPGGPYLDKGLRLTKEDFAIDAHVFIDEDGRMYMFYATDFLDHARIGTGTVVDRMIDPFTLAGEPRPISRAAYEWQVFDPARVSKGGVKWHTVEGSFVLKRKGKYYQMFSGGNWTNQSYGVGFATSDRVLCDEEWDQPCDALEKPLVIRTLPGLVNGPGHNSVVRGPDNRQLYCVYHRWVDDARVLSIDPLDWAGDRLLVLGPSYSPEPVPVAPTIAAFDAPQPWGAYLSGGTWQVNGNEARQSSTRQRGEARWELPAPQFTMEVTIRADKPANGAYGVVLLGERKRAAQFGIQPADGVLLVRVRGAQRGYPLPGGFDPTSDHLLRLDVDGSRVTVMLDNLASRWRLKLPFEPFDVVLFTDGLAATFVAPEITLGWEELFYGPETSATELDWEGDEDWPVRDGLLLSPAKPRESAMIARMAPTETYELVVNVRLMDAEVGGGYGISPALSADQNGPVLALERTEAGWKLVAGDGDSGVESSWTLPEGFDATQWQQWRLRVTHMGVSVALEGQELRQLPLPQPGTHVGIAASHAHAAFDMVRVTALA
jgi:GH43 family beta-xylosidase